MAVKFKCDFKFSLYILISSFRCAQMSVKRARYHRCRHRRRHPPPPPPPPPPHHHHHHHHHHVVSLTTQPLPKRVLRIVPSRASFVSLQYFLVSVMSPISCVRLFLRLPVARSYIQFSSSECLILTSCNRVVTISVKHPSCRLVHDMDFQSHSRRLLTK